MSRTRFIVVAIVIGMVACSNNEATSTTTTTTSGTGGSGGAAAGGSGGGGAAAGGGGSAPEYFAVFESLASDLVTVDANATHDIFFYSSASASLVLVSHAEGSADSANNGSQDATLSRNGRYAVFRSAATNMQSAVADGNGTEDVFRADLETGVITLVSVNAAGTAAGNGFCGSAAVSDDGRYVAFLSSSTDLQTQVTDGNGTTDLFVRDMVTGVTTLVSVDAGGSAAADGASNCYGRFMTPDGRYVVYSSDASDVTSVPDTNGLSDVFVRDLVAGTTTLVSANAAGSAAGTGSSVAYGNSISDDGRSIVFESDASDLQTAVADTNGATDTFVRNMAAGATTLVSADEAGTNAVGSASNGVCSITSDGRWVSFASDSTELQSSVADANAALDVFVRDLTSGVTTLASVASSGASAADAASYDPYLSGDGAIVFFTSEGTNLVAGVADGNAGASDAYRRDLAAATTGAVSVSQSGGATGNEWAYVEGAAGP